MFRRRSIFGGLMTIFLIVALVAGGFALFRFGFAQGYTAGIAGEGDGSTLTVPGPYSHGFGPYFGYPVGLFVFGRLIGMFFFIGLLFMLFGGIKRMFWFRHWKTAGAPGSEAWKDWLGHPAAHKWGAPPWARDEKEPDDADKPEETSESDE
jgi:hypothetical protein